jgi:DedD protein
VADIHDTDDGFHEIQLSGKQLVFLFMATTVVSVVIFLCGVFVGRGVQAQQPLDALTDPVPMASSAAASAPAPVVDTGPQAVEPPSPPAEAVELSYKRRLEGDSPRESLDVPPPASRTAPPAAAQAPVVTQPATRPGSRAERVAEPAPPAAIPAQTPRTTPVSNANSSDSFVVQVHALRDRNAANTIVKRLMAKGYPAFLVSGDTGIYRVQVGRFTERQEAERTRERLKKEEKFETWITH